MVCECKELSWAILALNFQSVSAWTLKEECYHMHRYTQREFSKTCKCVVNLQLHVPIDLKVKMSVIISTNKLIELLPWWCIGTTAHETTGGVTWANRSLYYMLAWFIIISYSFEFHQCVPGIWTSWLQCQRLPWCVCTLGYRESFDLRAVEGTNMFMVRYNWKKHPTYIYLLATSLLSSLRVRHRWSGQ